MTKKKKAGRDTKELKNFKLGENETKYPTTYAPEMLEAFDNKNVGRVAWTSLLCPEFTSLCPKTGQPDFAKITINYVADKKMVESKSLKLYLFSFRNHGDFHEDCIQTICDDLFDLMKPKYIEVHGHFTPRGGISIYPFASASDGSKEFEALRKERFAKYQVPGPVS